MLFLDSLHVIQDLMGIILFLLKVFLLGGKISKTPVSNLNTCSMQISDNDLTATKKGGSQISMGKQRQGNKSIISLHNHKKKKNHMFR